MNNDRDCRNCRHNGYSMLRQSDFISCSHPVVIAKTPRPEPGDPVWVNAMTADIRVSEMDSLQMHSCPTWFPKRRKVQK